MLSGDREWSSPDHANGSQENVRGEPAIGLVLGPKDPGSPDNANTPMLSMPQCWFAGLVQRFARSSQRANETTSGTNGLIRIP